MTTLPTSPLLLTPGLREHAARLREFVAALIFRRVFASSWHDKPNDLDLMHGAGADFVEENGTFHGYDGSEYVITVQPKGLAELQAGLIGKVREKVDDHSPASSALTEIRHALANYDTALASLGKSEAAGGGA